MRRNSLVVLFIVILSIFTLLAGGDNTVIVGCTSKANMTRDKLQELIWELNDGAWCDVTERTEDELDKRELI